MIPKLFFFCWLIAITAASLLPSSTLPEDVPLPLWADKGVHILMYLMLARLAMPALLPRQHRQNRKSVLVVLAGVLAYGFLLEILQPLLSARTFEWADMLANAIGTLGGGLLWACPRPNILQHQMQSPSTKA